VELLQSSGCDAVASVVALPPHHSPDYVMRIEGGALVPFLPDGARVIRRQDARRAYYRDGTVYCFWRRTLLESGSIYGRRCLPLVLAPDEALTIDEPRDWALAEAALAVRR
jgi:CMP-N-acetylneuraminic acid synthetase